MQRLMSLPLALRVLVIALALGTLVTLAMGIPALISSTSERISALVQGVEGRQFDTREVTVDSEEPDVSPETEEYLSQVKDTNVGAVEAFLEIDEKLRKFDSLTPEDVEEIEADRKEVAENLDRVEELDPPRSTRNSTSSSVQPSWISTRRPGWLTLWLPTPIPSPPPCRRRTISF